MRLGIVVKSCSTRLISLFLSSYQKGQVSNVSNKKKEWYLSPLSVGSVGSVGRTTSVEVGAGGRNVGCGWTL